MGRGPYQSVPLTEGTQKEEATLLAGAVEKVESTKPGVSATKMDELLPSLGYSARPSVEVAAVGSVGAEGWLCCSPEEANCMVGVRVCECNSKVSTVKPGGKTKGIDCQRPSDDGGEGGFGGSE